MWKNIIVGLATDDNMAYARYMLDTDTHSEYVILIAFPLQQWLLEREPRC